ncbi:MAG: putative quinol monooxygenase [bacterium]|nr:putative quinol monooxygenase [bacterium]
MITVIAILKAQEGKAKEMETAIRAYLPKVQKENGTVAYILHRSQMDPGKFLFYEKYQDTEALAAHGQSQEFQDLFAKVGPLLAEQPSIEMYEEVAKKG